MNVLDKIFCGTHIGKVNKLELEVENLKISNSTIQKDKERLLEDKKQLQIERDFYKSKTINLKEVELESKIIASRPQVQIYQQRFEIDGVYQMDLRDFFTIYDSRVPVVEGKTNDEKVLNALKWVAKNVKYEYDKTSYSKPEYWAYSYQTLKRGVGDCEDGAILLANVIVRSGIPYYRVNVNSGIVFGGCSHAYVSYCRESDNKFVVLDWMYKSNLLIENRKIHKQDEEYFNPLKGYTIMFSFNQKHIFSSIRTYDDFPE